MEYVDEKIYTNHDLAETGYFVSCMLCDHIAYDIGLRSYICRKNNQLIRRGNQHLQKDHMRLIQEYEKKTIISDKPWK